jgi:CelD/BcsL family acetyltransferase involved in cellulose biosynthesis
MRSAIPLPATERPSARLCSGAARRDHATAVTLDPASDPRWLDFVLTHPSASIFHHPAWLALLRDQYGFSVFATCMLREGNVIAGIPLCEVRGPLGGRRWICLPFSDRCGPLGAAPEDCDELMRCVVTAAREGAAPLEVRDAVGPQDSFALSADHWSHVMPISGAPDELFRNLHPDVRRRIKKATADGLRTEIRNDAGAMQTFYSLHLMTRKKQGVPIQPHGYFDKLQQRIVDAGLGFVALTHVADRPIAAAVFCMFRDTLLYKYGASDPGALNLSPNYLMFWDSILHGKQSGLRSLDFGKTATDNEGLRFFKNKWKAVEERLPYSFSPYAPVVSPRKRALMGAAQAVIRRSPEWVCRATGELLYKHLAP